MKQKGKDVATRVASWITALAAIVVASRYLMGRFSKRRGTALKDKGVTGASRCSLDNDPPKLWSRVDDGMNSCSGSVALRARGRHFCWGSLEHGALN